MLAAGCPRLSAGNVEPLVSVSPMGLDFGVVAPNATATLKLQISDTGRTSLHLARFIMSGEPPGVFITDAMPRTLASGNSTEISVMMIAPGAPGVYAGALTIDSNAGNAPTFSVQLGVQVEAITPADAGTPDSGSDAGTPDAGMDGGTPDSGPMDAGSPDAGPCPPGQTLCGGVCTDTSSDMNNCGHCANPCRPTAPSTGGCLQGLCVMTLASGSPYIPEGVAADDTNVYWTAGGAGTPFPTPEGIVMKVPINGGTPVTLDTPEGYPIGIAVDQSNVYYEQTPLDVDAGQFSTFSVVMNVPIAGGSSSTLAVNQDAASNLAADNGSAYWTTSVIPTGTVVSASPSGGTVATLAANQSQPTALTISDGTIYWVDEDPSGAIVSLPLAGGQPTTLLAGAVWANGICTDSSSVYWSSFPGGVMGDSSNGQVESLGLGGGNPITLATGLPTPAGIVTDSSSLYLAVYAASGLSGAIVSLPVSGGTVTTLAAHQGSPASIVLAGGSLFWVNRGGNHEVMRLVLP
jgi:hypothetical protein